MLKEHISLILFASMWEEKEKNEREWKYKVSLIFTPAALARQVLLIFFQPAY